MDHEFHARIIVIQIPTSKPSLSYGIPLSLPVRVDSLPPRWHASQLGKAKSSATSSKSGYFSRALLKPGRQTDDATRESRKPEIFLRAICSGTEKYSVSRDNLVRYEASEGKYILFI